MKTETKEKIEIFKQVIQGLFKLLIGVSILLSSIALYNHFTNPEVQDKPKIPQVSEPEVSECDCEKYVKEWNELMGNTLKPQYEWCDYIIFEWDEEGSGHKKITVRDMVLDGGIDASEKVKDCDQQKK
jgi:hypothetical protein